MLCVTRFIFFLSLLGLWHIDNIVHCRKYQQCYVVPSQADCLVHGIVPDRNIVCNKLATYVRKFQTQGLIACSTMTFLKGSHHVSISNNARVSFCSCGHGHFDDITFSGLGTAKEVIIHGIHVAFYNINVTVRNITFKDSTFVRSEENATRTRTSHNLNGMTITDCRFVSSSMTLLGINLLVRHSVFSNSSQTVITLYSSVVTLKGTVSFTNNLGRNGGALALIGTTVYIERRANVTFQNNRALEKGGAIFVDNLDLLLYAQNIPSYCFYVVANFFKGISKQIIYFIDNRAKLGGDHVYGGILKSTCISTDCQCKMSYVIFNNLFYFEPSLNSSLTLSALSGNPTRVCACDSSGQPQCAKLGYIFQTGLKVYPGEKFNISVVIVGGDFGTTIGTVYAKFASTTNASSSSISLDSIDVNSITCTNLTYSILSSAAKEVLYLSTDDRDIEGDFSYVQYRSKISTDVRDYNENDKINPSLLTGFMFINITLLPCPPGFSLSPSNNCDCYPSLTKMGFKCVFSDRKGYLAWNSLLWVGHAFIQDNSTEDSGVIVSRLCPLHYCKADHKFINLQNGSDAQCEFNHSGVLCGGCEQGLSIAIGSTNCVHCPNGNNLALLLFFASAGFLLIFAISILNLTVTQGKINGLIFYANVIWSYQVSFFPHRAKDLSPFLRAFIAWLNLDFGIEACFVKGLDAYWKAWLQFVFPFYTASLFLVGLHYSSKISKIFGSRSVPTLATLLFLSYTKLLRAVIAALSFITLTSYPNKTKEFVWLVDGNLRYGHSPHVFLLVMATACLILLWIPYTALLFSMQWLRRFDHRRPLRVIGKFKPLYDAYFAPLRDGHHYWFGVLLLAQCAVLIMSSVTFNAPSFGLVGLVVISTFMFCYLNCMRVYKDKSTILVDSSLHINIILLVSGLQFFNRSVITTISISIAFAEFCMIIFWNIMPKKIKEKLIMMCPSLSKAAQGQLVMEPLRLSSFEEITSYRRYRDSILDHRDETPGN